MKVKRILIITDGFPIIEGAETYLKKEYDMLKSSFDYVEVLTDLLETGIKKTKGTYTYVPSIKITLLALLNRKLWIEIFSEILCSRNFSLAKFKIAVDYYRKAIDFKKFIVGYKFDIVYTYWITPKTLGACLANKLVVSRAHGHDVYYERHPKNYLPFRREIMNRIKLIGVISEQGNSYLSKKFPKFSAKIKTRRLGVEVPISFHSAKKNDGLHIVSCSALIPLKQVNLLILALKNISFPVKWTHFGTGPLESELIKLSKLLPPNIHVQWKGFVENEKILRFYADECPDLFINTSLTEGIPVSIMEANSYSIPAIAPDVGGIKEIVYNRNWLLSSSFKEEELKNKLIKFNEEYQKDKNKLRKEVFDFAGSNLSHKKVYREWINDLSNG